MNEDDIVFVEYPENDEKLKIRPLKRPNRYNYNQQHKKMKITKSIYNSDELPMIPNEITDIKVESIPSPKSKPSRLSIIDLLCCCKKNY
tara:strand:+ start:455 stop:721 length:267 start_codon:yes stop_codon:yes gene_type:complete